MALMPITAPKALINSQMTTRIIKSGFFTFMPPHAFFKIF
jgi:hypothetical protein